MANSNEFDGCISVDDGTTDREAYPKRWIAVLVQMCTEKKVGEKLNRLNIENYIPTQREIHQWSDRKKVIDRVVIPMVVFVNIDEKTEKQLRTYSYIYKVLTYPGQRASAVIPPEQIEQLKFMLNYADSRVELNDESYEVGETVRISRGPLKGLEGYLSLVKDDKPVVAIRLECIGYACVSVLKCDIEKIRN